MLGYRSQYYYGSPYNEDFLEPLYEKEYQNNTLRRIKWVYKLFSYLMSLSKVTFKYMITKGFSSQLFKKSDNLV